MKKLLFISIAALLASGCASQSVTPFPTEELPNNVCVVKHKEVKEGVVNAIQDGFKKNGVETRVITGSYDVSGGKFLQPYTAPTWKQPLINVAEAAGCETMVFYTAHWGWDIVPYMRWANIWAQDRDEKQIAQAGYFSGNGFGKFSKARGTILDMIDKMFGTYKK